MSSPNDKGGSPPAPAVARAVQILDYLANTKSDAGLSEIASAIGLNKSTCFNILRTLADNALVIKDARFPVYRLGPKLVELGTASRRNFAHGKHLNEMVRPLVDRLGITCLIAQPLPADRGAVVIDRVIPRGRDVLTAVIGMVYPITAPAIGRVLLAHRDLEEVLANVHAQPDVSESDLERLVESLDTVREKGFGWSELEYRSDVNAVSAAVLDSMGEVIVVLCLIGYTEHLPRERMNEAGKALSEVAQRIETALLQERVSWGTTR